MYQSALVLKNRAGDYTNIISPNISSWTSGTRVLSTGDYVVADSNSGSVTRIDHATGSQVDLASNFQWPNSIDVGSNDDLYISDFSTGEVVRMNAWNPDDNEFIGGGLDQANGVALSPDEQTLYVIESWKATVVAFDRDPGGNGWNGPRMIVYIPNGNFQGLNVDYCGNLYITDVWIDNQDYSNILRATPDGASVEIVTQIPSWYVPNLRFGTDIGGWVRTSLYASDRDLGKIYEFDVGMPGRAHPAIP